LSSSEEVLLWLDNMDFFVLPTRSEGLCRCIVEAISRGCPCFATNICSMPELLQQECLFELGDDKKLAELILYYSNNIEELKAVAIRNYNKSKEYGFEILRKRRNDFLNEFKKYCEEKDAT
jgi:glycosyltransferase involved in cell wall biosynthesis